MVTQGISIQAEGFFPSEKRWLFYRRFCSTTNKKADVIVIHGALEHSGRYEELAMNLTKQGYNLYMLDLTGHGRSEGKRGYIHKFEDYLIDIGNFYAFLKIHKNMETPFFFGHSMGGLLATVFTAWGKCPVRGLILSAPLFAMQRPMPFFRRLFTKFISAIYPGFSLAHHLEPTHLSHDLAVVEDYIADPLVQHRFNSRCLMQILQAMKKIQSTSPYVTVPCLIFHGEKDAMSNIEATKKFFYSLGTSKKDLYIVQGAYHEVFQEKGRQKIFEKLVEWLDSETSKENAPAH